MKTTQESFNLKELEVFLSEKLAHKSVDIVSLMVNCFAENDQITILLQHSPPETSSSAQIFALIKKLIRQKSWTTKNKFKISLAIYGQSPYSRDNFTILPRQQSQKTVSKKDQKRHSKTNFLYLLFGSSLFIFSVIYLITRPCVIGKCEYITNAQQLATQSEQLIREQNLLEASYKLQEALNKAQQIPWFSSYYQEGQNLSNNYQNNLNNLQQFLADIKIANQSLIQYQQQPKNLVEWQQVLQNLTQVINNLRKVPSSSNFYSISQESLNIYEEKLTELTKLYHQEITAENNILTASEMAQIAALRQEQAYTLKDWHLVNMTWILVTKRLQSVTPQNISYQQTKQLLTQYQPIIKEAKEKLKQEEMAYKTYQYAINTGQKAQNAENEQQYSLAIKNWKNALNILLKINQNTSQFDQAQSLISEYKTNLNQAEKQLKLVQIKQKAKEDLNKICLNQEKICTYNIDKDNIIKVYLNQTYLQKVLQIAMALQQQVDLRQHIASVQYALEAVSNKHKLPLEIYHSDGGLLFSYTPN